MKSFSTALIVIFVLLGQIVFAQGDLLTPPLDFKDSIPEKEIVKGEILFLSEIYPGCLVDSVLNEDCPAVKNETELIIPSKYRMEDISWVKKFKNITLLSADWNFISILPDTFPSKLKTINLDGNKLKIEKASDSPVFPEGLKSLSLRGSRDTISVLPKLPNSIEELSIGYNKIETIDSLPSSLKRLLAYYGEIANLPDELPNNLNYVNLGYNKLTELSASIISSNIDTLLLRDNNISNVSTLPSGLIVLEMNNYFSISTKITSFTAELPTTLKRLNLQNNELTTLPELNDGLEYIDVTNNQLEAIGDLPSSLRNADFSNNEITSISSINGVYTLNLSNNILSTLPELPANLLSLNLNNNTLESLPTIPQDVYSLEVSNNALETLPTLPEGIRTLNLSKNQLSGDLNNLPDSLRTLDLSYNNITSFEPVTHLQSLIFSNNDVTEFPYEVIPENIRTLYLDSNLIESIPLLNEKLERIKVKGNNIECLPNLTENLQSTDLGVICGYNCWKGDLNGYGNWSESTNWSEGAVPTTTDIVFIFNGSPTLDEDVTIKSLDIRSAYIQGNKTLSITNELSNKGGSYIYCDIEFSGTSKQYLDLASGYYENIIINNTNGLKLIRNGEKNSVAYGSIYINSNYSVNPEYETNIKSLSILKGYLDLNQAFLETVQLSGYCAVANGIRNGQVNYSTTAYKGWVFIGTMMKSQRLRNLANSFNLGFGGNAQSIYGYDGTKSEDFGWTKPTGFNSTFQPGDGYRAYKFKSGEIYYSGLPFTGYKELNVTYSASGWNGGGWNFVANPYLSTIDWTASEGWTKSNIDNAIYIWNPAKEMYAAYVDGVPQNGGRSLIAAGQGFFVKANGASPLLTLDEKVKSTTKTAFLRTAALPQIFRVYLANKENLTDELVIRIKEESSTNFDSEYDALKKLSGKHNLSITSEDGEDLSISSIPSAKGNYPLKVIGGIEGEEYTFSFSGLENLLESEMFLIDEKEMTEISLNNETKYTFKASDNDENRFRIGFKSGVATDLNNLFSSQISSYPNPTEGDYYIDLKHSSEAKIIVFDQMGKIVTQLESNNKSIIKVPLTSYPNGVYHLQIEHQGKKETLKVVKL